MNNEDKIHINSFKFYDRDELEELTKQYYLENQELKKQLEEKENQQKEFMEWLESESHRLSGDALLNSSFIEVRTILLKYKEIIGGKNK